MKKIINPWRNHEGYNCFGCSPDNPIGLHLEFYEDGDYIVSTWHPEHNYQGWVDTMHGGILSMLIDNLRLIRLFIQPVLTATAFPLMKRKA